MTDYDHAPPTVSILMTCYNHEDLVRDAIESVLAQEFTDWELLIADDASEDGSRDVIRQYGARDARIHVVCHEQNRGKASLMNELCGRARGEFIAFLDSDDLWLPGRLSTQLAVLRDRPEIDILHADGILEDMRDPERRRVDLAWPPDVDGQRFTQFHRTPTGVDSFQDLLKGNFIFYSSVLGRREALLRGRFEERIRRSIDWLYFLEVAEQGGRFGFVPEPLAVYRVHGQNIQNVVHGTTEQFQPRLLVLEKFGRCMAPCLASRHFEGAGRGHLLAGDVRGGVRLLSESFRHHRSLRLAALVALAAAAFIPGVGHLLRSVQLYSINRRR